MPDAETMNEALPPHAALAEAKSLLAARRFAEAEHIFGDLLRRGSDRSSYPVLRIAYAHLRAYEAQRIRIYPA